MIEPFESHPCAGASDAVTPPRLDVWLAERELLSAAHGLRNVASATTSSTREREARIAYQAAWLRFLVSLCNLPMAERPAAVEHTIERLRVAHLSLRPGEAVGLPHAAADESPSGTDVSV
jgi:hypothetical protein